MLPVLIITPKQKWVCETDFMGDAATKKIQKERKKKKKIHKHLIFFMIIAKTEKRRKKKNSCKIYRNKPE